MSKEELMECILDSMPTQLVFIDEECVVRYMNREAKYQNFNVLGYEDIMNKSILDCHKTEKGKQAILNMTKMFQQNTPEIQSAHPTGNNELIYTVPVRDENGKYLGMYERFELNMKK